MKTKHSIGIILLLLFPLIMSCRQKRISGEGSIETENRNAAAFSSIKIDAPVDADITITEGATPSIRLKGYPNILNEIKTEVANGTLRIYKDELIHLSNNDLVAEIIVPTLDMLKISGAADANIHGVITAPDFKLIVSGAGDVSIDGVNAETFSASLTGAGNLVVKGGNVIKLVYTVAGAGEISSFPLQSKEAKVSVTGVGDVELSVSDKLSATVAGAGDINYRGAPQLSTNITGAGSVEQDN